MKKKKDQYNDQQILEGIRSSDDEILEYVYKQYYPMIYKMVVTNRGTSDEARDIFQDGIMVLYEKSLDKNFELRSSPGTFLYSVCYQTWLNKLNRQKKREQPGEEIPDQPEDSEHKKEESEHIHYWMKQLLQQVGKSCRDILVKKYYEKRRDKEIARDLNLSGADYVKTQRYRCLKQLRELYTSMVKNH